MNSTRSKTKKLIVECLKKIRPRFFFRCAIGLKFRIAVALSPLRISRRLRLAKKKDVLDVVFLAANTAMWKYDDVFRLMQRHQRFSPRIIFAPQVELPADELLRTETEMREYFSAKGFPVTEFSSKKESRKAFLKKQQPDIVFIAQGYSGFRFLPADFPRALVCYAPYSFMTSSCRSTFNLPALNMAWKLFLSSEAHLLDAKRLMQNRARNAVVSGHLNADRFSSDSCSFADEWKLKEHSRKRIIYAPHFSISDNALLPYSTFLETGKMILEIAKKFSAKTQWVFKPHPWLYRYLCKHPEWGEKRASEYYDAWRNLENGTIAEGEYIDLFMTSDALIHDCGSFRCEYFYTGKPVMHLVKEGQLKNDGEIGRIAYDTHYHGRSREDVARFLEEVVLGGNDPMKAARERFYEKYLLPPNGQSVAQNILDEIERGLGWK